VAAAAAADDGSSDDDDDSVEMLSVGATLDLTGPGCPRFTTTFFGRPAVLGPDDICPSCGFTGDLHGGL
jgi:hypothetical protein